MRHNIEPENDKALYGSNGSEEKDIAHNVQYGITAGVHTGVAEVRDRPLQTHRALKPRQMTMIALGGSIGTGLVIGSGPALAKCGPGALLVAYIMVGAVCYSLMVALGEMSTMFPSRRGFAGHASKFIDPAFGFTVALAYMCKYLIVSAFQIVAGALVIKFWNANINSAVFITIEIAAVVAINILGIRWFGEIEFWLSTMKLVVLTGLILLGLIIDLGGVPGQERIGFRYWQDGKAFKPYKQEGDLGKFLGMIAALVSALFAFMGTELVGVTAGEAKNPRKAIPSAIKKTFFRILVFYIGSILIIGMVVDSSSPLLAAANKKGTSGGASASPFVVAITSAGIKVLPSIINAAIFLFTFSASNSDQYIASRTLYGMAMDGHAPKIFAKCTKNGSPWVAFIFTACFMGLAYTASSTEALVVFNYMASTVTLFASLAWISILACHVAFMRGMKRQGISRDALPYKSPFQPYLTYYGLGLTVLISLLKGFDSFMPWNVVGFITNYLAIPIYVFGYLGYKFLRRTSYVRLDEIDFDINTEEYDDIESDEEAERLLASMDWKQRLWYRIKNW